MRSVLLVRNPRNLEKLAVANRPRGYQFETDRDQRSFWYRVELESSKHTTGVVKHIHDGVVLSASTSEPAIAKQLYRTSDVSAALNIGRILARRCLQAGIHFVQSSLSEEEILRSERKRAFVKALEEGGLSLKEPEPITPKYDSDNRYHTEYDDMQRDPNAPI